MGYKGTWEYDVEGYNFWILEKNHNGEIFYRITHIQEDKHEIEWIIKISPTDYDWYSYRFIYNPPKIEFIENKSNIDVPERILKIMFEEFFNKV